jgi:hypothetical protein
VTPTKSDDIGGLIRASAKRHLAPLGFVQKGRSRTWIWDQGFWAIIVEFQPSSYAKASYLNVAASWFWSERDFWAFSYGGRVSNLFFEFQSKEQFAPKAEILAVQAAEESHRLMRMFSKLPLIAKELAREANLSIEAGHPHVWELYNAAVACGLVDREEDTRRFLDKLIPLLRAEVDWQKILREQSVRLRSELGSRTRFIDEVYGIILRTRSLLKLRPVDHPLPPLVLNLS